MTRATSEFSGELEELRFWVRDEDDIMKEKEETQKPQTRLYLSTPLIPHRHVE